MATSKPSSSKVHGYDIFPSRFSGHVSPIKQPRTKRNFSKIYARKPVFAQTSWINRRKIYFGQVDEWDTKLVDHFIKIGTDSASCKDLRPLPWDRIQTRLERDVQGGRVNVDIRMSFKYHKNYFLVKRGFTFGQRTVPEDSRHVLQTTEVPLVFYKADDPGITVGERLLRVKEQHLYRRYVLQPYTVYELRPGKVYVLVALAPTFFSLHKVLLDRHLPFEGVDPTHDAPAQEIRSPYFYQVPPQIPSLDNLTSSGFRDMTDFCVSPTRKRRCLRVAHDAYVLPPPSPSIGRRTSLFCPTSSRRPSSSFCDRRRHRRHRSPNHSRRRRHRSQNNSRRRRHWSCLRLYSRCRRRYQNCPRRPCRLRCPRSYTLPNYLV